MHNNIAGPDTEANFLSNCNIQFFGEKLGDEYETLLCLQAQLTSDDESQFHEVMSFHQWL